MLFTQGCRWVGVRLGFLVVSTILCAGLSQARDFSVAVYNVENLFDLDGQAAYDDYQPQLYKAKHLRTKLDNISKVVARLDKAALGPDVLILCELEVDQTSSESKLSPETLVAQQSSRTFEQLLSEDTASAPRDWSAETWLLKAFQDRGLTGYSVVAGSDSAADRYEDGNRKGVKCVVFTRFPVLDVRNHPIPNARNILELRLNVDGAPLYVFANHWKSGAGDGVTERIRVEDARVLRRRLDEILGSNPQADIVIGGDFNSQYNQRQRYPQMKETAMNDVLGSQGDELAIRASKPDLYNLWYELPQSKRGSDVYHGEWGTLIQLLLSRGLYDYQGIQYVDGSFEVGRYADLNEAADGTPLRWSSEGSGLGFSDHFPVVARFKVVASERPGQWLELKNPSDGHTPSDGPRVSLSREELSKRATDLSRLPAGTDLRDGGFSGQLFLVEGRPVFGQKLAVEFMNATFEVYAPEAQFRDQLRKQWKTAGKVRFYGELGQFKGRWQFVIKQQDWLLSVE